MQKYFETTVDLERFDKKITLQVIGTATKGEGADYGFDIERVYWGSVDVTDLIDVLFGSAEQIEDIYLSICNHIEGGLFEEVII